MTVGRAGSRGYAAAAIAATAALFAIAVPPIGVAPVAVIALVPLIAAIARAGSPRAALARGVLASLAVTVAVFHWLPGSVHAFFGLPTTWSWLVFPLYGLVAQPQLALWAVVRWYGRDHRGVALASAAAYTGFDWLVPKLFHDTLGVAFVGGGGWASQVVDLGGVYLLTFAVVLTAEVIAAAPAYLRDRTRTHVRTAALLAAAGWLAILGYGALRAGQLERAIAGAPTLRVGVIQANIGNVEKAMAEQGDLEGIVATLKRYGELSDQLATAAAPPDVLVWPETAYPLAFRAHRSTTDDDLDRELATYVHERKVPLLFGGYDRANGEEFNSAILLTPSGDHTTYHKRILIPFGEYVPLIGRAKFGVGGTPRVLELRHAGRTTRLGMIICYESLFTEHAVAAVDDGAQVLANLTNDSWFVSVAEQQLHLTMAALRSLETRRAQVRATNTGISALVLPTGEITLATEPDVAIARVLAAPVVDVAPTLVMRLGNWPGPVGLAIVVVMVLHARRRRGLPARRADRR